MTLTEVQRQVSCPKCLAGVGRLCRRVDGSEFNSVHKERRLELQRSPRSHYLLGLIDTPTPYVSLEEWAAYTYLGAA